MFRIEPGEEIDFGSLNEVNDNVRQTWNLLGPLRLTEIVRNSIEPIDFDLPYGRTKDRYDTQIFGQYKE